MGKPGAADVTYAGQVSARPNRDSMPIRFTQPQACVGRRLWGALRDDGNGQPARGVPRWSQLHRSALSQGSNNSVTFRETGCWAHRVQVRRAWWQRLCLSVGMSRLLNQQTQSLEPKWDRKDTSHVFLQRWVSDGNESRTSVLSVRVDLGPAGSRKGT